MTNDERERQRAEDERRAYMRELLTEAAQIMQEELADDAPSFRTLGGPFLVEALGRWNSDLAQGDELRITSATLEELVKNYDFDYEPEDLDEED